VTEKYNAANIHISIDASGSMHGEKWNKALMTAVSIAKAASMIGNMNVQISFRSTTGYGNTAMPVILMAYDSKTDKISKIRDLFVYLHPGGLTPEGLCFEAILSKMEEKQNGLDSYFINFSDGQPYFGKQNFGYSGSEAIEHTRKQVKKMRLKGINILSYFISSAGGYSLQNFQRMYGKDASTINVQDLGQLAKSLNNMFLEQ
jgi:nitric oxide reductase activation protein